MVNGSNTKVLLPFVFMDNVGKKHKFVPEDTTAPTLYINHQADKRPMNKDSACSSHPLLCFDCIVGPHQFAI